MEELFGKFVMSYLLMPLVAVLLGKRNVLDCQEKSITSQ